MPQLVWSETEDRVSREMFARRCSFTEIANELGTKTRSAVAGRMKRAGLRQNPVIPMVKRVRLRTVEERNRDNAARRMVRELNNDKRAARAVAIWEAPPLAPVNAAHVSLIDLAADGCKFPFGKSDYKFCNASRIADTPYCQAHARLVYTKPRPW